MKLPESFDRAMRDLRRAQIPVYAGNAAFFLVLSFLPLLTLLLAALQYTVFRPRTCWRCSRASCRMRFCRCFPIFCKKAYQKSGAAIISLSALTAAWSASRGIYGISSGAFRRAGCRKQEAICACGFCACFTCCYLYWDWF